VVNVMFSVVAVVAVILVVDSAATEKVMFDGSMVDFSVVNADTVTLLAGETVAIDEVVVLVRLVAAVTVDVVNVFVIAVGIVVLAVEIMSAVVGFAGIVVVSLSTARTVVDIVK